VLWSLVVAVVAALALGTLFAAGRKLGARLPEPKGTIRFELARTVDDVRRHLAATGRREKELRSVKVDYGLIVLYAGLFVTLGIVLGQRDGAWAPQLGAIAIGFALLAGLLDVVENLGLKRSLDRPRADIEHEVVWAVRNAARAKFAALAVVAGALAVLLWAGDGAWAMPVVGTLFAAAALLGYFGIANERWLPLFFVFLAIAGLAAAALLVALAAGFDPG
jgi:hypothetical protein